MSDQFIQVSWLRRDGEARQTGFLGYAAESCALQYAGELERNRQVLCVAVHSRHVEKSAAHPTQSDVTWELIRSHGIVNE